MKKIVSLLIALVLVMTLAISAHAVTPDLGVPDMPEIPDISDDIHIEIPDEVFDDWLAEHPVPPLTPTEPTTPVEPIIMSALDGSTWAEWFRGWFRWIPGFCN